MTIEKCIIGMAIDELQARIDFNALGILDIHFTDQSCSEAWKAIRALQNANAEVDLTTVSERAPNLSGFLVDCLQNKPVSQNASWYGDQLLRAHWLRESAQSLNLTVNELMKAKLGDDIDKIQSNLESTAKNLLDKYRSKTSTLNHISKIMLSYTETLEKRAVDFKQGITVGIKTGIKSLDEAIHGWMNGGLYIIAARTSLGKTTLAINFANVALNDGKNVLFFTNEMPEQQICEKFVSLRTGVFNVKLFNGDLYERDFDLLHKELPIFSKKNLYIDDSSGRKLHKIISECKKAHSNKSCDMIIVDYIQQVYTGKNSFNSKRVEELGEISNALKELALELKVPIICLAQLNRQAENSDDPPLLSHIRDSGCIEQDADAVIFIHRDRNVGEGRSKILISKNRFGPCCEFEVGVNLKVNKFF